ncbi:hypothetical protein [Verrucomicrobium spinosum]|uniref:hypothetical protein n=1 Tax=Verrucomicrobium spinosum TaxID=2736 RepID=UPI0009461B3B|nr:hypothetical protein [Verrucomicrobium spinosum]
MIIPSEALVGGEKALRAELIGEIRALAELAEGAEYPDLVQGWIDSVARDNGLKSTSDESATMDDLQTLLVRANEEVKSLQSRDVPEGGSDKVGAEPLRETSDFHLVSASEAASPEGSGGVVVLDEIKSEVQPELDIASGGDGFFLKAHKAVEAARKIVKQKSKIAAKKAAEASRQVVKKSAKAVAKKVAKPAKKSAVKKAGTKKGGASK